MKKLLFVLIALLMVAAMVAPAFAQEEDGFSITGAPKSARPLEADDTYVSTIDFSVGDWLGEPGVRTASTEEDCDGSPSCWGLNGNQVKLTDPEQEILDLREGGYLMFTFAGGTLELDEVAITVDPFEDHTWFVILRGKRPGPGDRNLPVEVTDYNPGFGLATNLPAGARISQDYFDQNVTTAHTAGNCGLTGCTEVSALFYDVNTGGWVVINQAELDGDWVLVDTNIE